MFPPASPEDTETFSTPPTTPGIVPLSSSRTPPLTAATAPAPAAVSVATALMTDTSNNDQQHQRHQRRGTVRPHNLLIDPAKGTIRGVIGHDIVLQRTPDGEATILIPIGHSNSIPDIQEQSVSRPRLQQHNMYGALNSPCFVHSHLERGASLKDWLTQQQHANENVGVSKTISPQALPPTVNEEEHEVDIEVDYANSLTRQLAETAIGVREMNKALSRARVHSNLSSILIITKARDNRLVKLTRDLAIYLMGKEHPHGGDKRLIVYVDAQLRYSKRFDPDGIRAEHPEFFAAVPRRRSSSSSVVSMHSERSNSEAKDEGQLRYWTSDMCSRSPHLFDFVVTLGGDGTVLFTSWLFQRVVPPVLPFALGSLGFLTNFDFSDYKAVMDIAIENGIRVNLRMRFTCTVYRAIAEKETKKRKAVKKGCTGEILMKDLERGGWEALESGYPQTPAAQGGKDREIKCFTTRPVATFEVLNDLVVDRGPSPYVSLLELFGDEHHMTTVQADGLVVATPTGSTAYSLSAGGALVHPEIPAILISPICPHTLSFRPMLLPDTMELRICVPFNSRSTAWASFDGRGRVELKQGDHIKVTASKYPFPTVCADKQSTDWFHAISRTLKWNERERQKSFVVVEEGPAREKEREKRDSTPTRQELNGNRSAAAAAAAAVSAFDDPHAGPDAEDASDSEEDEDEASDGEGQDDEFDITDSSPEGAAAAAKRAEARANSSRESSPPESSRSSSVGTTATGSGAGAGPRIAELSSEREQYTMPITTTPHPDAPAYDESLAAAKVLKGRRDDMQRTPRAPTHQRLAVPPSHPPPPVPQIHPNPHVHHPAHPHHPSAHGVATPSGLRHEFTSSPPRPYFRRHNSSRSADFDAGTHRRAFAVWGHDESSDDNSP